MIRHTRLFPQRPRSAGHSLADALEFAGGPGVDGAKLILLRAGVAALLNASHPGIDYPMSAAEVTSAVEAALASDNRDTMLDLAEELDAMNDGACVIGAGEPGLPDLIVSQIVFGTPTSTALPRTMTVKNVGTVAVDVNGVTIQGHYSADATLNLGVDAAAGGRVLSTTSLMLAPGATMNVTSNGILPGPEFAYVLVTVDYGQSVVEADETNNTTALALPSF